MRSINGNISFNEMRTPVENAVEQTKKFVFFGGSYILSSIIKKKEVHLILCVCCVCKL